MQIKQTETNHIIMQLGQQNKQSYQILKGGQMYISWLIKIGRCQKGQVARHICPLKTMNNTIQGKRKLITLYTSLLAC